MYDPSDQPDHPLTQTFSRSVYDCTRGALQAVMLEGYLQHHTLKLRPTDKSAAFEALGVKTGQICGYFVAGIAESGLCPRLYLK